jgi:hypothetical protein
MVRRGGIIAPDKDDAVVGKGDVDAAAIDVPPGGLVPGDNPVGVFDQCRGHGGVLPVAGKAGAAMIYAETARGGQPGWRPLARAT